RWPRSVGTQMRCSCRCFAPRAVHPADRSPQLAALLTSVPIFFSTSAVNFFRAKDVGQMLPSSRRAASWKPNVEYLVLYFRPLWKKQTILPSFAYAGIPYQVFRDRDRALAL